MARTVQVMLWVGMPCCVVLLLGVIGCRAGGSTDSVPLITAGESPCDVVEAHLKGDTRQHFLEFRRQLESSSFFLALTEAIGGIEGECRTSTQAGILEFSYAFSATVSLRARFQPEISYADHSLIGRSGMTVIDALRYLKLDERDQFGAEGCGIKWESASERGSLQDSGLRERYRGAICNCQGYIDSDSLGVRAIGFRSAC